MITAYIQAAMRRAKYEIIPDDGYVYGHIPECNGVWAHKKTLEKCREELQSVLEEWILFGFHRHLPLPVIEGIDLNIKDVRKKKVVA